MILHETPSAVATALGVSCRTVAKWLARYRAEGQAGLLDRSSRPRRMGARQNHRRPLADVENIVSRSANPPALSVPPIPAFRVPPPPVAQVEDALQMSPTAMLAAPFGTDKPNEVGNMPPIDRV